MAKNYGNYKERLSASEIAIFETITRDQLGYFEYSTEARNEWELTATARLQVKLETVLNILTNQFDKTIRTENSIRRKFRAVAKKIRAGKSFD
jgi:hypothetical protein